MAPARIRTALMVLLTGSLLASGSPAPAADTAPAHPKQGVTFQKSSLKDLGSRRGANHRTWDRAVAAAIESEDAEILDAIFKTRTRHDNGQPMAMYRIDLFKIYRAKPEFFVATAALHFDGNLDCAVDLLVPRSQMIEYWQIESIARKQGPKASKNLKTFVRRSRHHHQRMEKGLDSDLRLGACW